MHFQVAYHEIVCRYLPANHLPCWRFPPRSSTWARLTPSAGSASTSPSRSEPATCLVDRPRIHSRQRSKQAKRNLRRQDPVWVSGYWGVRFHVQPFAQSSLTAFQPRRTAIEKGCQIHPDNVNARQNHHATVLSDVAHMIVGNCVFSFKAESYSLRVARSANRLFAVGLIERSLRIP